jgi:UDP-2,3-diacylglucosamine pyrophosphatase LpxH
MPAMPFDTRRSPRHAGRTLFLSDLHLGALGSRGGLVLDFLRRHPSQTYVLVGDVLDLWQPLLPHWTARDQAVIDHLNRRQRDGARLVYVRGNHDPHPGRAPAHARLAVEPVAMHVHRAGDGRRYLVVHGDEVDSRLIRTHAMTRLGSRIDHALRRIDRSVGRLRANPGTSRSAVEWMLMAANALVYAGRAHERRMVEMAREAGLDGVICGHFHIAGLHDLFGLTYANCGDWVDSMTALIDEGDGELRLLCGRAASVVRALARRPAPVTGG